MDVAVYLKDLLLEKGLAHIPGLGGFSSDYQAAGFDAVSGLYHPPCRNYYFSDQAEPNSLLEKYISDRENLSSSDAQAEIGEYVADCWYILNKGQRLQLMGVGVIFKDAEGKLKFEVDPLLVHGGDFYGLESIPATRHELPPPPPPSSGARLQLDQHRDLLAPPARHGLGTILDSQHREGSHWATASSPSTSRN